jgi:3-isopropylmalate/(R)-2-methylmalate dehydratase small subunit
MEKFIVESGVAVPLRRSNVDTDQIIPAVYLKRITKSGFEDGLFASWRGDKDFVLNQEPYKNGQVLIAGPDFGTGSSREHAVWALKDYGFKAVFSSKFADIFRGNSGKQGLVTGIISEADTEKLWDAIEAQPGIEATVDLEKQTVTVGNVSAHFDIDEYTRWRIMEGLDDIGLTLRDEQAITDFEAKRDSWRPKTLPAKG